jgi:hypothetical protein
MRYVERVVEHLLLLLGLRAVLPRAAPLVRRADLRRRRHPRRHAQSDAPPGSSFRAPLQERRHRRRARAQPCAADTHGHTVSTRDRPEAAHRREIDQSPHLNSTHLGCAKLLEGPAGSSTAVANTSPLHPPLSLRIPVFGFCSLLPLPAFPVGNGTRSRGHEPSRKLLAAQYAATWVQ